MNYVDLWGLCKSESDGEKNIYNVTLLGGDVKLLIGGGINFGVAWDEEEHFAITTTLSVGFGVEASVDTP